MKKATRKPMLLGTALFLAAGSLLGCKESFLTDASTPQGVLDASVLANAAGVEGNLIAAYRALDWTTGLNGSQAAAASNWIWGSVTSDDAYKGTEPTDFTAINDVENYSWSTSQVDGILNDKWRQTYEGVSRSNATLRLLAQVVKDQPSAITATDQAGIEGEATFLRGYYHLQAYLMWGNVPYLRETDEDLRKAASPAATVLDEVINDFDAAIAKLPDTPRNGNVGRATSWTAKAYKGKALMFKKDFAGARTVFTEIIASNVYDLQPSYDQVWTGFKQYENGKETILAYQASANDGEPSGNNANYGERLNFPHSGSPFGCCGFHQPSQNIVNSFVVNPVSGLPTMITNPAGWNADNAEYDAAKTATMTIDPRLDWTVGRDGVPYKDWGAHDVTWIRAPANGGPYSPKKNVHEKSSGAQSSVGWVNTQLNSVNIHLFRYADLLLLAAEAEAEAGGDLTKALTYVNRVRDRAAKKAQGPGTSSSDIAVAIDSPLITWAIYKVGQYPAFADAAAAQDAIRAERKIELAMEGHRFFDLKRWDILEITLNCYVGNSACPDGVGGGKENTRRSYLQQAVVVAPRHKLYPIPSVQVNLSQVGSENRVPQNPGW